jgi:hypothetical protein
MPGCLGLQEAVFFMMLQDGDLYNFRCVLLACLLKGSLTAPHSYSSEWVLLVD